MSDWAYINRGRVRRGLLGSEDADGFNGAFFLIVLGRRVRVIASDGGGWQHVSVSQVDSKFTPNWDVMCAVKDLFWKDEDVVCQFHPKKSEYVNNHPGCLHLWRPNDGRHFPTPDMAMIGIKELGVL